MASRAAIGEFVGQGAADFANADGRDLDPEDGPNFTEPYDHDGVGQGTGEP